MDGDSRDWSSLPSDITQHITQFLPVIDGVRCRAVCSSWHTAISPDVQLPSPWFVVPYDDGRCTFHSLTTTADIYSFTALQPNTVGTGINIVGSQNGYIVAVSQLLDVRITNLFCRVSSKSYKLPPLTTLFGIDPVFNSNELWGFIHCFTPLFLTCSHPLSKFNHLFFRKMVFSIPNPDSKDFVALASCFQGRLIYVRAGDAGWKHFVTDNPEYNNSTVDVVFHDGKFYSLNGDCRVLAYDFSTSLPDVTVFSRADVPLGFLIADKYLAFSTKGEMLIVFRKAERINLPGGRRTKCSTKNCLVIRYNSGENPYWDIVENLGEECLLLGNNNAMAVSAGNEGLIRNNNIYFTDNISTLLYQGKDGWEEALRDVVVYDMKKKKVEDFLPLDFYLDKPAPIWFDSRLSSD